MSVQTPVLVRWLPLAFVFAAMSVAPHIVGLEAMAILVVCTLMGTVAAGVVGRLDRAVMGLTIAYLLIQLGFVVAAFLVRGDVVMHIAG